MKFQRQVVLASYIADFATRSQRLIIKVDGETHAGNVGYDTTRTAVPEVLGHRVTRFTDTRRAA